MGMDRSLQQRIEQHIQSVLSDVSHPNVVRLKAGIQILLTTDEKTFLSISSQSVQESLSALKKLWQDPASVLQVSMDRETLGEVKQFIKDYTLDHLHLLDTRNSVVLTSQEAIHSLETEERMTKLVHASAVLNVMKGAHLEQNLEQKLLKAGFKQEAIPQLIAQATEHTLKLHDIVLRDDATALKESVAIPGIDLNYPSQEGFTPLHIAVREGNLDMTRLLLAQPAININAVSMNGWTPLHLAARLGYAEIVACLINDSRIEINLCNSDGWSALQWAAWHGHEDIMYLMLHHPKIDMTLRDHTQSTALHWASRNGHARVINQLLKAGSDPNAVDDDQKTPLHWAAWAGHHGALNALLSSGKLTAESMNRLDKEGLAPLHWVVKNGDVGMLKDLLKSPLVDKQLEDSSYLSALDWAKKMEHPEMILILEKK